MKKISGILPLLALIVVFLVTGNDALAQRRSERSRSGKEVRQAEDKKVQETDELVKDAKDSLDVRGEGTRETIGDRDDRRREGVRGEVERSRDEMKTERERVRRAGDEGEAPAGEARAEAGERKPVRENDMETEQDRANRGHGNAYGRDKGDLQGREFGQARAQEAKMKREAHEQELDTQLRQGEEKVLQARQRIKISKEELEQERAAGRISDQDYQQKKEKIDRAEKAVEELDQKLREGKKLKEGR